MERVQGSGQSAGQVIGLRMARRDETALADAYAEYSTSLLSYLARMVGTTEAEDVMQRTFLDAWRHAGTYDPRQRFTGWLFTIAHNRAVDTLRTRRYELVDVDLATDLVGEDGRETADRLADATEVRAAVAQLPAHERVVLHLTYFEQLSQREVAERLGVPVGTVKARASRGTRRLRSLLRPGELQCA